MLITLSLFVAACDGTGRPEGTTADGGQLDRIVELEASPAALPEWHLGQRILWIPGYADSAMQRPFLETVTDAQWLSDGRILVVDMGADRLHIYGATGDYLRSLGGPGEGPDEFSWIRSVTVSNGDTIFAYDVRSRALKVFHPDGGFVASVRIPDPEGALGAAQVWRIGRDRFLHALSRPRETGFDVRRLTQTVGRGEVQQFEEIMTLHVVSATATIAGPVAFPGLQSGLVGGVGNVLAPFGAVPVVAVSRGRVVYGSGREFEMIEADSLLRTRRRIIWSGFSEPVSEDEVVSVRRRAVAAGFGDEMVSAMFSEELVPLRRPAMEGVLLGDGGDIWVARFEASVPKRRETMWYVLGPAGEATARLRLPVEWGGRLTAVRGNSLLMVTQDSFEVPMVEVREIER